jgi:hypothetical protein
LDLHLCIEESRHSFHFHFFVTVVVVVSTDHFIIVTGPIFIFILVIRGQKLGFALVWFQPRSALSSEKNFPFFGLPSASLPSLPSLSSPLSALLTQA